MKNLFTFAHQPEAQSFIKEWKAEPVKLAGSFKCFEANEAYLLILGEGSINALVSLASFLGQFHTKVKNIYNFGTVGLLDNILALDVGTVLRVRTVYGQQNIDSMFFHSFSTNYSQVTFDCVSATERVLRADVKNYLNRFAPLVDREAWSVGWVANKYNLPFYCIKIVSDLADANTNCEAIVKNSKHYSDLLLDFYLDDVSSETVKKINFDIKKIILDFFDNHYYFTHSQKDRLISLIQSLALKKSKAIDQLLAEFKDNDYILQLNQTKLSSKEKSKKLISYLNICLSPLKHQIFNQLQAIQEEHKSQNISLIFDNELERVDFELNATIKNQSDLDQLSQVITKMSFDKFSKVMQGSELDV